MEENSAINYRGNLKNLQLENLIIKSICEQLKADFPNMDLIKLNVELINEICNIIEEVVVSKKLKNVVKLDLFCRIYESLFGKNILDSNRQFLVSTIEYLHFNNHIKSISFLSKVFKFIRKFL